MKLRITLTIDPEIAKRAKTIAHLRGTNVSALIEDLVRRTPLTTRSPKVSLGQQWAGKFSVKKTTKGDTKLRALKARYSIKP